MVELEALESYDHDTSIESGAIRAAPEIQFHSLNVKFPKSFDTLAKLCKLIPVCEKPLGVWLRHVQMNL